MTKIVIDIPEFTSKDCKEIHTKYQDFWRGVNDLAPYIADMMKQEAQNYAGDSDNSDNLRNIGDDLMDQQGEAEE